jgi:hypothetical protein
VLFTFPRHEVSETRGVVYSVTAVVRRIQVKDMMQPIEANWGLDSVCLIVCVLLGFVSSDDALLRP